MFNKIIASRQKFTAHIWFSNSSFSLSLDYISIGITCIIILTETRTEHIVSRLATLTSFLIFIFPSTDSGPTYVFIHFPYGSRENFFTLHFMSLLLFELLRHNSPDHTFTESQNVWVDLRRSPGVTTLLKDTLRCLLRRVCRWLLRILTDEPSQPFWANCSSAQLPWQ